MADYGVKNVTDLMDQIGPGPIRWQAPELLDPDQYNIEFRYTMATDVYAFASFCIEVRLPACHFHRADGCLGIYGGISLP